MDNEGLTDAQEITAITEAEETPRGGAATGGESYICHSGRLNDVETSPVNADTDGNGYWDGWVGGYNVSYSRNVILYPENLKDGDGIETGERVDEQVGTHRIAEAPTPTDRYAVIDGEKRHSNLHLGELHWETDPSADDSAPYDQTELTFEVDYHAQADVDALRLFNSSGAVNQTYALYGMNITFIIDDEITGSDSAEIEDAYEADDLEDENHDRQGSTAYFFITKDWVGDNPEGKASSAGSNSLEGYDYGAFIFTSEHGFPFQTHYAKTSVHEIGHLLGAGRIDDTGYSLKETEFPGEVYSEGTKETRDTADKTLERVSLEGSSTFNWSVMTGGYHDSINDKPMADKYIAFSIEELLELEFESIDSRGDRFFPF